MIRTLTAIAAFAAIVSPASAADRRVSIVGKDPATIEKDIRSAAQSVCREAYAGDNLGFYQTGYCIAAAVRAAQIKVQEAQAANAKAGDQFAMAR